MENSYVQCRMYHAGVFMKQCYITKGGVSSKYIMWNVQTCRVGYVLYEISLTTK